MSVWNMTDFDDLVKEHCTDIAQEKADRSNCAHHVVDSRTVHDLDSDMLVAEGWMPLDNDSMDQDDFNRRHQFHLPHEQDPLCRMHWPTHGLCGQCLSSGPITKACAHDPCMDDNDRFCKAVATARTRIILDAKWLSQLVFFTEHHSEELFKDDNDDQNTKMDHSNSNVLEFGPNTNALADHVRTNESLLESIEELPPE